MSVFWIADPTLPILLALVAGGLAAPSNSYAMPNGPSAPVRKLRSHNLAVAALTRAASSAEPGSTRSSDVLEPVMAQ